MQYPGSSLDEPGGDVCNILLAGTLIAPTSMGAFFYSANLLPDNLSPQLSAIPFPLHHS